MTTKLMTKTKIVWTPWGNNIALAIYAPTKAKVERIFNLCYNYGVVSADTSLHMLKQDKKGAFGYFKTTWEELKKAAHLPLIEKFLPRNKKQIEAAREDFLQDNKSFELSI